MPDDKSLLEKSLGKLLGFEDGASDVVDHLLTIESKDDLLEYLTQLLGENTPEVLAFVDNMGRYNLGEPLVHSQDDDEKSESPKITMSQSAASISSTTTKPIGNVAPAGSESSKEVLTMNRRIQKQSKSRVPPPKGKLTTVAVPSTSSPNGDSTTGRIANVSLVVGPISTAVSHIPKKSQPTKGKATKVCGCYGTYHKPLTNCLYCGRISCVEEGYDYCAFCGYMVENVLDGNDHSEDPSWERKERLLRFDREFARRTEIIDDQADYQGPSTWMDDEERAQAEENQAKQIDALKRATQVMNLAL